MAPNLAPSRTLPIQSPPDFGQFPEHAFFYSPRRPFILSSKEQRRNDSLFLMAGPAKHIYSSTKLAHVGDSVKKEKEIVR